MEWLYGVPEDLRSASTLDLLDYFLKSPFIGQQLYPVSSIFNGSKQKADFTAHEAFLELLSREDFVYELENYALEYQQNFRVRLLARQVRYKWFANMDNQRSNALTQK